MGSPLLPLLCILGRAVRSISDALRVNHLGYSLDFYPTDI